MANIQRVGDLEIDQSLEFQRREWRAERFGWVAMGLIIAAALLGLFGGGGPFGVVVAGEDGAQGVRVEYDRFSRFKAPLTVRIHVPAGAAVDGMIRLGIDRGYLDELQIEQITPEPDGVETDSDRLIYRFELAAPDVALEAAFHFTAQGLGWHGGSVGLETGPSVNFSHFVYP